MQTPRLRPRLLLIVLVALLAGGALFGGLWLSQGRDRIASEKPLTGKPVSAPAAGPQEVVIRGDAQGRPAALATQSPLDLKRWQATASATTSDNPQAGDNPAHVHLYVSGLIALIVPGTRVRVLEQQGDARRVQILDGSHQGATGYMNSSDVGQPASLSLLPHHDLPTESQ